MCAAFRKQLIMLLIIISSLQINATDLFPIGIDTSYHFSFSAFSGHSRGGLTTIGKIKWSIDGITERSADSRFISIKQEKIIERKSFHMAGMPELEYDSVFIPPRQINDLIAMIDSANVCHTVDNKYIFVHDPFLPVPPAYCTMDTVITKQVYICMTLPCDLNLYMYDEPALIHDYFSYFTQDEKGPASYTFHSWGNRGGMAGGNSRESWTRIDITSVKRYIPIKEKPQRLPSDFLFTISGKRVPFGNTQKTRGILISSSVNSQKPQLFFNGK